MDNDEGAFYLGIRITTYNLLRLIKLTNFPSAEILEMSFSLSRLRGEKKTTIGTGQLMSDAIKNTHLK